MTMQVGLILVALVMNMLSILRCLAYGSDCPLQLRNHKPPVGALCAVRNHEKISRFQHDAPAIASDIFGSHFAD